MKSTLTALGLLLGACATSDASEGWTATTNAERVAWENNTTAWMITCSGRDQASCFSRAAAVCPSGYVRLREAPQGVNWLLHVRCN